MTAPTPISEELFASLAHELERTGRVIIGAQLLGKLEAWYRLARRMEAALRAQEEAERIIPMEDTGRSYRAFYRKQQLRHKTDAVNLRRAILAELDRPS